MKKLGRRIVCVRPLWRRRSSIRRLALRSGKSRSIWPENDKYTTCVTPAVSAAAKRLSTPAISVVRMSLIPGTKEKGMAAAVSMTADTSRHAASRETRSRRSPTRVSTPASWRARTLAGSAEGRTSARTDITAGREATADVAADETGCADDEDHGRTLRDAPPAGRLVTRLALSRDTGLALRQALRGSGIVDASVLSGKCETAPRRGWTLTGSEGRGPGAREVGRDRGPVSRQPTPRGVPPAWARPLAGGWPRSRCCR